MFNGEFWQNTSGGDFYSHQIPYSCRFTKGDSSYLYRAIDGSASDSSVYTLSMWVKRSSISYDYATLQGNSGGNNYWRFESADKLIGYTQKTNTNTAASKDVTGWMHIVINGRDVDTVNVWINGVAQTITISGSGSYLSMFKSSTSINLGYGNASGQYFDGYMAEVHGLYNINAAASDFGQSKEGVWIPKEYSGSYGSYGFYLKFEASGDLGNDSSGNNNDFTASGMGADHQVLDSPTFSTE
jgi:hypothetical protein